MSSGCLYMGLITASASVVYTPPSGKVTTFNVRFVNPNTAVAKVTAGFAQSATASFTSYLEYDATVGANGGVLEDTAVVVRYPQSFIVQVSASTAVSVTLWGFEDTVSL